MSGLATLDELQAFAEKHKRGIGSTDAAAILSVSPWGTPYSVWEEKVGEAEVREPSLPMWLGLRLQDTVGELYRLRTERRIRADRKQHVHPQLAWQMTHLDFRVWGDPTRLVECKTGWSKDGWGEPGSSNIPVHYWTQVQHQMAVTGASVVDVAVLFGHRDFQTYTVQRDADFIYKMTAAEQEFWEQHVLTGVPPPLDHSDAARRFLGRRYPQADGLILPATPEQQQLVEQYRLADYNLAQVTQEHGRLKNRLIEIIGANSGLRGGDFEITYRNVKEGKPEVAWELVAIGLRRLLKEHGIEEEEKIEALISVYTSPGRKAYRQFIFKDRSEGEIE